MATKKKAAPKKAAKKVVKKVAAKKVIKKEVVKAPVKKPKPSVKKTAPKNAEEISAKKADQVVVNLIRATHEEARQAAIIIIQQMGPGYFTIADMMKSSKNGNLIIMKNPSHPGLKQKLSWNDAKNAIIGIFKFGLVEQHPETKDCFKIRLDKEFRINYFNNQKEQLVTKMSDANIVISMIRAEEEFKAPVPEMKIVK